MPGVPALTLALGSQAGGVKAELRERFAPSMRFTVELPLTRLFVMKRGERLATRRSAWV